MGIQTLVFSRVYFAGDYSVGKPLFLLVFRIIKPINAISSIKPTSIILISV